MINKRPIQDKTRPRCNQDQEENKTRPILDWDYSKRRLRKDQDQTKTKRRWYQSGDQYKTSDQDETVTKSHIVVCIVVLVMCSIVSLSAPYVLISSGYHCGMYSLLYYTLLTFSLAYTTCFIYYFSDNNWLIFIFKIHSDLRILTHPHLVGVGVDFVFPRKVERMKKEGRRTTHT